MNVLTRGARNAFRNTTRTVAVVAILGLVIGLALAMVVARQAVGQKIESVKASIGTTVTVAPAGVQGFQGGGDPLTSEQVDKVEALEHVASVSGSLSDRWDTETTNLESAVDAGSLGQRFGQNGGQGRVMINGQQMDMATFTPPIQVTGTNDLSTSAAANEGKVTITSGEVYGAESTKNEALIGKTLAEKNSLSVGSTFTAYGQDVTVVGIYDASTEFANNSVVMPLAALQVLSDQTGSITSMTVTADSIDNVASVAAAIKTALGDAADVTSQQDSSEQALEPLESIMTVSLGSSIAAAIAGAVIILMIMVMTVRERRREVGVLKAIGASNGRVISQFAVESVVLTVLGLLLGLVIGIAVSGPVTNALVSGSSEEPAAETSMGAPRGQGMTRNIAELRPGGAIAQQQVDIDTSDIAGTFGWGVIGYGTLGAVLIAVAGSAAAASVITRVRPAEVMRAE